MMKTIWPVVVCGLMLVGCASQAPHGVDAEGEPLPAPVREASIVAPQEFEEPLLAENEEQIIEAVPEGSPANSASGLDKPMESSTEVAAEPVSSGVVIVEDAPDPEVVLRESSAEVDDRADSSATAEVEGLVQLALPEDEIVTATAADDPNAESDVAAYLLDEAENSFQRENYEKARGQSERALALEPTAARAYLIMARIELAEGMSDRAAEMARQGLASSSDSDEIFEQLNQILGEIAEMPPLSEPTGAQLEPTPDSTSPL